VTPDRFHLDRKTGKVLDKHVNTKSLQRTPAGWTEVPLEKQNQLCLDDHQLAELAALGSHVEAFYGEARDIEWAWADGQFWLLQARPITTAGAAEREQVRREEIAALAASADREGTVWGRYNLAEILPEPTPMTWTIVRRFMSGKGGFGLMYRDFGFRPEPALDNLGVYDLVCGRPYCNLSREPGMYANGMPFEHPFAALKAAPQKALYPKAQLNWSRAGWRFWLFFPATMVRSIGLAVRLAGQQRTLAARLREQTFPAFDQETTAEAKVDLEHLDSPALVQRLEYWIQRTLCDFARDSLKPTVLAGFLMANLEQMLARRLGLERASAAVTELTVGARPDADADLAGALCDLSAGRLDRPAFLERFGHRGNQEMELAQPRWSEDPSTLNRLAVHSGRSINAESASFEAALKRVSTEAKLQPTQVVALEKELKDLHDFLGLRETAKHHLMRGYALIRRILLELGRRHKVGEGVFYLAPEELSRLIAGEDVAILVAQRRRRRSLALSLEVPAVLFSDDLEAIGRAQPVEGAGVLQGIPLSAGVAEGPALVLSEPANFDPPSEPYVLVCPSTDPAWVPLFINAKALAMETGGVLSHGAIVAREFGLPAVAGLPGIHHLLKSGTYLRVDGTSGTVVIKEA
jgi:pyruvate,water dikinase